MTSFSTTTSTGASLMTSFSTTTSASMAARDGSRPVACLTRPTASPSSSAARTKPATDMAARAPQATGQRRSAGSGASARAKERDGWTWGRLRSRLTVARSASSSRRHSAHAARCSRTREASEALTWPSTYADSSSRSLPCLPILKNSNTSPLLRTKMTKLIG